MGSVGVIGRYIKLGHWYVGLIGLNFEQGNAQAQAKRFGMLKSVNKVLREKAVRYLYQICKRLDRLC